MTRTGSEMERPTYNPPARAANADASVTSTTLLDRVGQGQDEVASAEFVRRYSPMVRAIATSCGITPEDTEDVVQEVMVSAVSALRDHRYDRERGRYKAFLKGIIAHKVRDALAGRRIHAASRSAEAAGRRTVGRVLAVPVPDIVDPSPAPADAFEAAFDAEWHKVAIETALDDIRHEFEPVTFQAFDLYVRKDMPPRDVARLLGVSRNVVYIAKTRVLARLRELLGPEAAPSSCRDTPSPGQLEAPVKPATGGS